MQHYPSCIYATDNNSKSQLLLFVFFVERHMADISEQILDQLATLYDSQDIVNKP